MAARVIDRLARHPTAVWVSTVALALAGVVAWRSIPVTLAPATMPQRIVVSAARPGTAPEAMEALVTAPVEAAARRVRGVRETRSLTDEQEGWGVATVEVELAAGHGTHFAWLELREALAALRRTLPSDVRGPTLGALATDPRQTAEDELRVDVYGGPDPAMLAPLARDVVAPALRRVHGVAAVALASDERPVLDVALSSHAAGALGVSVSDVMAALADAEVSSSAGTVEAAGVRRSLTVATGVRGVDDLARVHVPRGVGEPGLARLGDLARIDRRVAPTEALHRVNGQAVVTLILRRDPAAGARPLLRALETHLRASTRAAELSFAIDAGGLVAIAEQEEALFARLALVTVSLAIGAALAMGGLVPAALVLAVTSLSVLAAVVLLAVRGESVHAMTGSGLVLGAAAAGHDTLVVLAAVRRRAARGLPPGLAARQGAREAWPAVAGSGASMLVLLTPLAYAGEEVRAHWLPLGIALAAARCASALLCVSLVPAVARLGLVRVASARATWPSRSAGRAAAWSSGCAVRRPAAVAIVAALAVAGVLTASLAAEWTEWSGDSRELPHVLEATVRFEGGVTLDVAHGVAGDMERRFGGAPGVMRLTTDVHPGVVRLRFLFAPAALGGPLPGRLRDELLAAGARVGGARVYVSGGAGSMHGTSALEYRLVVRGYELATVRSIAEGVAERLRRFPRTAGVTATGDEWGRGETALELVLRPDRWALARAGLRADDLASAVATVLGRTEGTVRVGGERLQLRLGVGREGALDRQALLALPVAAPSGIGVRIGALAAVEWRRSPGRIVREDQRYQRAVSFDFRGPARLGDRVRDAVLASTHLPPGYSMRAVDGRTVERAERARLRLVAAAAVLLGYLVLAAALESAVLPLCVVPVVPLAFCTALLTPMVLGVPPARDGVAAAAVAAALAAASGAYLVHRARSLGRTVAGAAGEAGGWAVRRAAREVARPLAAVGVALAVAAALAGLGPTKPGAEAWALAGGVLAAVPFVQFAVPACYLLVARAVARLGNAARTP